MNPTGISWCTDTWNPVTGCTPVSIGCENCYAARMANRLRGRCGYPQDDPFKVTCHPERLNDPVRAKKHRRIFICSMGDLFHKDVSEKFVTRIFDIIYCAPHHDYMMLTKRPYTMKLSSQHLLNFYHASFFKNLWFGITIENQETWEIRKEPLKELSRHFPVFVSAEPLLGPIDMGDISWLDWLIVGGETGPGARVMKPDWVTSISRQASFYDISYFFKQWGDNSKSDYYQDVPLRHYALMSPDYRNRRQYPKNMRV